MIGLNNRINNRFKVIMGIRGGPLFSVILREWDWGLCVKGSYLSTLPAQADRRMVRSNKGRRLRDVRSLSDSRGRHNML